MQVNSVSSANLGSQASFKAKIDLETFANLSDKDLKNLAYAKASHDVNDKKHKRINNALFYSIPIVAGLNAAVNTAAPKIIRKSTKSLKNMLSGMHRLDRLKSFGKTAALWTSMFLAADAVFAVKHYVDKKSPSVKEFSVEHPVLTTLATFAVGLAAVFGVSKGLPKLAKKFGKTQLVKDLVKKETKFAQKLGSNKVLNKISENLAKVPSSIKTFGKGLLNWGPLLLVLTSLTHTSSHERVKTAEYVNNYQALKNAQTQVIENLASVEE